MKKLLKSIVFGNIELLWNIFMNNLICLWNVPLKKFSFLKSERMKNASKTTWVKVKPFQYYLQFFKVTANLGMSIYKEQGFFNTTWVNSPASCTIKIKLHFQKLMTNASFQELFILLIKCHRCR